METPCVCADCGHEQTTMNPCMKCKSPRVVTVSFCEEVFGPNWRKAFVEPGQPGELTQADLPPGVTLNG